MKPSLVEIGWSPGEVWLFPRVSGASLKYRVPHQRALLGSDLPNGSLVGGRAQNQRLNRHHHDQPSGGNAEMRAQHGSCA